MTPDQIRASMPVDRDVHVTVAVGSGTSTFHVTVVHHARDAVIVGSHPDLLTIPHDAIVDVSWSATGALVRG